MVKAGHMDDINKIFGPRRAGEQMEQFTEPKAKRVKRCKEPGERFWQFAVAFVVGAVDFVFLMVVFC